MINPESVPVESSHGHLTLSEGLSHSADPAAHHVLFFLLLLTILVVVAVLINAVRAGRFHDAALALTRMLSWLAPLMGLLSAALQISSTGLYAAEAGIDSPTIWALPITIAAWAVAIGAVCGGIGVVLTAALRISGPPRSRASRD